MKKGIALEAALEIKDFAINTLNLSKIMAHCDYRNVSSYSLMQKIGVTLESDTGTITYPKNNETVQKLTYSILVNK